MRQVIVPVLMISLLLTGCGKNEDHEENMEQFRTGLSQTEEISFTADVTADLGDSDFLCRLRCTASDEETTIEVVEPEIVAGVTARICEGEASLQYDGVELSVGTMDGSVSPISAIPIFLEAMTRGHILRCWTEKGETGELLAVQIYVDETGSALFYFENESMQPVHGELVIGDRTVIQCEISDFKAF